MRWEAVGLLERQEDTWLLSHDMDGGQVTKEVWMSCSEL